MAESEESGVQFEVLDKTKFGWLHVKAILVAGIGFFCDAYDLFIINLVVPMIGYVYYENHKVTAGDSTLLKGSAVVGTFFGQIIFGILGDILGRKSVYGISLLLMVLGAVVGAMSSSAERGLSAVAMLCIWRFILGIGIGGDYPLSAVITSEYATQKTRGMMMAAVFAMQGVGQLTAAIVAVVVLRCFKNAIEDDVMNVDYVWRLCIGLGCVPAVIGAYFRAQLPETPRFTAHVMGDSQQAKLDMAKVLQTESKDVELNQTGEMRKIPVTNKPNLSDFMRHYSNTKNLKVLVGCAMSWFFLDIAFYGLGLNQSIVLDAVGFTKKGSAYDVLFSTAYGNAIINLMGSVPGYYFTVGLVEIMGRVKIQLMGFAVLTIIFVILSAGYYAIKDQAVGLFIFLYCVGQFFFNFGPNSTTFIIPGEVFPTRYRSTSHGISAATGKLGAMVSSFGFTYMVSNSDPSPGVQKLLGIFAIFMFCGLLTTLLIPETKGLSLEEISNDESEEKI